MVLPQDPGQGVGKQESQLQCGPMGSVLSDAEISDDAASPSMTDLETKSPRYSVSLATLQLKQHLELPNAIRRFD